MSVAVRRHLANKVFSVDTNKSPLVVPHGVAYEQYMAATESEPPVMQISQSSIAFMFESGRPFTISDYAWKSDKRHEHEVDMWSNLVDRFSDLVAGMEKEK